MPLYRVSRLSVYDVPAESPEQAVEKIAVGIIPTRTLRKELDHVEVFDASVVELSVCGDPEAAAWAEVGT